MATENLHMTSDAKQRVSAFLANKGMALRTWLCGSVDGLCMVLHSLLEGLEVDCKEVSSEVSAG